MKKVIEILEKAGENTAKGITDNPFYIATRACYNANLLLNKALGILKAAPQWETPEQYKKRTGKAWPDFAAVYFYNQYFENGWGVCHYITAKKYYIFCVCATESGMPPADWKPEETGK
jgi:hypothetical protein